MSKYKKLTSAVSLVLSSAFLAATTLYAVAAHAETFPEGSKMAQLAKAGTIKVGTQSQYPLVGFQSFDGYTGFDIEIAKLIAGKLGIAADKVEFVPVTTSTREPFLSESKVDMILAAYTINPENQKVVDFAGPYYITPNSIMVPKGNPLNISKMEDLKGHKLCVPLGAAIVPYIKEHYAYLADSLVYFDSSAKCAEAIINGQVDASSTENAILAALAAQHDGKLEVITSIQYRPGEYGVGIQKTDDKVFCKWINQALDEIYADGSWAKAYQDTLGTVLSGPVPTPPGPGGTCR
ncbi:transporter substrate-binding domain-containing protein [Castellaniella sp.]|uniref:transporter substrate-binding domain-containing protein n=1 Tax=Castellaniella sp. TaxID=1955812 RepID=UPI003568FCEF